MFEVNKKMSQKVWLLDKGTAEAAAAATGQDLF
jgi:hypothetical protein